MVYNNLAIIFFQARSSSNPQLGDDATSWVSNLTQNGTDTPLSNHVNNVTEGIRNESDIRSVLSPVKPVNLLPQVPINSNSYRKLSENEEHDCEIIGNNFQY